MLTGEVTPRFEAVAQAGKDYSPSGIANYCYELTKEFNQFYHDYSILGADTDEEKLTPIISLSSLDAVILHVVPINEVSAPASSSSSEQAAKFTHKTTPKNNHSDIS